MEVKVIAFGKIAEITGKEFSIAASDTEALKEQLVVQFPQLADVKFAVAVNKKVTDENMALSNNDTVALMPPYSGG
ncbi:molybdopterin synthase sulfur carrier subunit [Chryseobacterium sp. SORGH_AS 447]|uniref:MoaD/ThiS family protein n=1 Tax=Chryseobacterium sp. SORGH_AS_0447 TaxID=3041769 RepID=UPI00277FB4AE|nr:MoaD/ThiS family protein [Chryseobacterium sp. SORGH_AS_0447]MDQ1161478.1 molybdopterin synthase sulfur carrier subunit [Chryseobacterium sp. SORGH_AS_0447]